MTPWEYAASFALSRAQPVAVLRNARLERRLALAEERIASNEAILLQCLHAVRCLERALNSLGLVIERASESLPGEHLGPNIQPPVH